jgi:parallel beta-helix repeat protein
MGSNIVVKGCHVENCGDVGIDFEGSDYCIASNNTVKNCGNSALATFFYSTEILFKDNVVTQDGKQFAGRTVNMFNIYNSSQQSVPIIILEGNIFTYTGDDGGYGTIKGDASKQFILKDNKLNDTIFSKVSTNSGRVIIDSNIITLSSNITTLPSNIIAVGGNHLTDGYAAEIKNNTIIGNANCIGISVTQDDFNRNTLSLIENNKIIHCTTSIQVRGWSSNVGIVPRFYVRDNIVTGAIENISEDGRGYMYLDENKNVSGGNIPNSVPTTGYWMKGQRIKFDNPDANGYTEAVCVTTGNPGTWQLYNQTGYDMSSMQVITKITIENPTPDTWYSLNIPNKNVACGGFVYGFYRRTNTSINGDLRNTVKCWSLVRGSWHDGSGKIVEINNSVSTEENEYLTLRLAHSDIQVKLTSNQETVSNIRITYIGTKLD